MPKTPFCLRLSADAHVLLAALAEYRGVSRAAIVEMAIREEAAACRLTSQRVFEAYSNLKEAPR